MATIDVGSGHGGRKSVDHQIPLIPFIDFLLCLVSFLLITAVWSQMARLDADARVPGPADSTRVLQQQKDRTLHIEMKGGADEGSFKLLWKEGSTVLSSFDVPKRAEHGVGGELAYPDLANKIAEEWSKSESRHYAAQDTALDQAVLHTDNATPFKEVVAVMDAVHTPKRDWTTPSGEVSKRAALNMTFSVN